MQASQPICECCTLASLDIRGSQDPEEGDLPEIRPLEPRKGYEAQVAAGVGVTGKSKQGG